MTRQTTLAAPPGEGSATARRPWRVPPGAVRLLAFGVALVVVLAGGWAVGRAIGPVAGGGASGSASGSESDAMAGHGGGSDAAGAGSDAGSEAAEEHGHDAAAPAGAEAEVPPGLAASQHGYTLVPLDGQPAAGVPTTFRFRVVDAGYAPVTRFAVEHEKLLHLVVVRRDGANFQHVHPELATDGTWSVPLTLPAAGGYRVFADFRPDGGPATTLGVDVQAGGDYRPQPPSGERRLSTVDGYTVTLAGPLVAGSTSLVAATVSRDGRPVTDLQPYLGAYGHLVALREGDLAYLHVHPEHGTDAGPQLAFGAEVPTAGRYLLFLDFQHGGSVHTASFVVDAADSAGRHP